MECFLCSNKDDFDSTNDFESITSSRVPASQKLASTVLQHLGNLLKVNLVFQSDAKVCGKCFQKLVEYDGMMVNLLTFQNRLKQMLQAALKDPEENIDQMQIIEEQENLSDVFNPELDTKEELIEIESGDNTIGVDDIISEYDDEVEATEVIMANEIEDDSMDDDMVNEQNPYHECIACGSTFKTKSELQKHVVEVHETKIYACNICGAIRRDEEYLELHMNIHDGKTENECRYCPKRFSRPVNTIRHMRKHWDKKKYQCEKCGERFSLDNMLYNHRQRHEAEENPIICSVCNQSFKSRKTYNHHMLIHQENRPRHHCPMCAKSFTERYTLKMHMKIHSEIKQEPTSGNELDQQKETDAAVTALVSDEICIICNLNIDGKEALDKHLQSEHDVILK